MPARLGLARSCSSAATAAVLERQCKRFMPSKCCYAIERAVIDHKLIKAPDMDKAQDIAPCHTRSGQVMSADPSACPP